MMPTVVVPMSRKSRGVRQRHGAPAFAQNDNVCPTKMAGRYALVSFLERNGLFKMRSNNHTTAIASTTRSNGSIHFMFMFMHISLSALVKSSAVVKARVLPKGDVLCFAHDRRGERAHSRDPVLRSGKVALPGIWYFAMSACDGVKRGKPEWPLAPRRYQLVLFL
jgi:hypothetical protein